ncbi:MAG: endolytic transglycosylase MltG [Reyranella sp.]|uniref:endolytic transglycosylase MltG n=1 Tax=Reyranella sp. TaxID=1929291 RepID=UPI000AA535AC|nr:endolytic transglycosylase MltG [Reyranella sp.]MBN9537711.1 endolytic transglycosylase MltG [Alphaproteobacteria bacterium]MBR2816865.1 endolytic transglycosylase MltG [Reyranella sp.]
MLSYFRWVLFFVALLVTLMGGALYLGHTILTAAGPLEKTKNVVIPRGAGPATMSKLLQEEGVISHPRLFRVALMIDPSPKPIKAGEYEVPAHTSMQALVELLQSGKVVQRRLTVPEGMTTAEVLDLLRKTEALTGEITIDVKEGDLLPETYFYSRDDTRDGLLMRMKEAMEKTLDEAWKKRTAGLPLANKRDALILASMIEKETAVPAERTRIAAVFINRLRRRMKLDSDPTTIYGLTLGKVPFNRELTRADLTSNTPYNTYVIMGLPRGPICNPGRASIVAATNPVRDRAIYFVADGQGGHAFALTLYEHQRNVERWRQIQRERAEAQGQTPPAPGPAPMVPIPPVLVPAR